MPRNQDNTHYAVDRNHDHMKSYHRHNDYRGHDKYDERSDRETRHRTNRDHHRQHDRRDRYKNHKYEEKLYRSSSCESNKNYSNYSNHSTESGQKRYNNNHHYHDKHHRKHHTRTAYSDIDDWKRKEKRNEYNGRHYLKGKYIETMRPNKKRKMNEYHREYRHYNRNRNRNRSRDRLRMAPQYDAEGNQIMSMTVYQIRNNKYSDQESASASDAVIKYESNLDEEALILVCNNENTLWNVVLNDIPRRSFGGYLCNPFNKEDLDLWWELLTDARGDIEWHRPKLANGKSLPRKAAWLVSAQCKCCYRYSLTKWKPIVFPKWFQTITDTVLMETGLRFEYGPNSCNINWYEDGRDSVGWHADDEALFESKYHDCLILSLSLGESRKFEIKLSQHDDSKAKIDIKQVILHNGDLMTMEGLFQKYYLHRVPKSYGVHKARINLTWRWIRKHYLYRDNCRLCTDEGPGNVTLL